MNVRDKVRLDRSRHAAPQIFEKLRAAIVSLDLTPGTVLARAELAERFGISQTPVRDALMRLGEEGLVDIFPQHATVVSRIDVAAARQAHYLRRSIELEVVRTLALQGGEAVARRLQAQIGVMQAAADPLEPEAFSQADLAFHRLMYEAAEVPRLWELVRSHSGHVDRLRHLHLPSAGKAASVLADHRRIAEAIAQGDAPGAQEALRTHLSGTLSQVDEICARHPDYVHAD
ncbi:GntR family transcriptional regulator [Acidovorax sp. SUPP1855]|uniref:GntR family transcriptional regulator n=1 Tax=Acidovorax sp. SUPP1855 TaxID=431774 RepID=UPI0023DE422C|nr:GntR family transcriptional regulator [Acidovorax sp. SUPP1855]GKS86301.1 GntR family transcriptional regulator [Acidovorax sp. SUPP1855]